MRRARPRRVSGGFEFEVVERGGAGQGVVDRLAVASALAEDLVVFESGDGVFGTGASFAEPAVVPVADDAAVRAAAG
jgi:hypothetical protein